MAIAENPNRRGMIFAGTGHGFFYSLDDGARWTQFKHGLPAAPVTWIAVPKLWHDVVVSTYGRGLFILSDISTLEQSDKVPTDAAAYATSLARHSGRRAADAPRSSTASRQRRPSQCAWKSSTATGR
jgi:hypothetical protein